MLHLAMENVSLMEGLVLEFGVFHGKTIRMIAEKFPTSQIHGFDTFSGIPENWHNTKKGSYSTHNVLPVHLITPSTRKLLNIRRFRTYVNLI
jgi:hypothetical protein